MNDNGTPIPDSLDRLLNAHHEREAERYDAAALIERIRATRAAQTPPAPVVPRTRSSRWTWAIGFTTIAACLVVAGMFFWKTDEPLRASPQALLQETQKTFHQPVYRCYLVEVQREVNLTDESNPFVSQAKQTRLWTRGDRFWMETTFPAFPRMKNYWGRDEQGTIWMTFGPREGILLTQAETPHWLSVYSDLCSMQPDKLLSDVLRDFDLQREDSPTDSSIQIIRANLKPGRFPAAVRSAVLEIDTETKVLRRLVLQRPAGGPGFQAPSMTTTYTLLETKNQDEIEYPLDGREGKREFYTANYKPELRQKFVFPLFGQRAVEWMKLPMKK